jgi:phage host-nuclease inhibitor protein Gam
MAHKTKRERVPETPIFSKLDDCDDAIREIKEIDRKITKVEDELEAQIDKLKSDAAAEIKPLKERRAFLEKAMVHYCVFFRPQIFTKGKTRKLVHGEVSFKKNPPKCEVIKGKWTIKGAISAIRANLSKSLQELFIREVPELNKESILAYDARLNNPPEDQDPEKAPEPVDWASIGLRIIRDEEEFGWNAYEANIAADTSEAPQPAAEAA